MKVFAILAATASSELVRIPFNVKDRLKHAKKTADFARSFWPNSWSYNEDGGANPIIEVGCYPVVC